jgi:hypothetical protein
MEEEIISMFPEDENGNRLKRFEVKMRKGKNGTVEKAIFIDNELLDWSIDMNSLMEAMRMGPKFFRAAQKDIERHFVESVSEVIGRKITVNDIKKATQTGWI